MTPADAIAQARAALAAGERVVVIRVAGGRVGDRVPVAAGPGRVPYGRIIAADEDGAVAAVDPWDLLAWAMARAAAGAA